MSRLHNALERWVWEWDARAVPASRKRRRKKKKKKEKKEKRGKREKEKKKGTHLWTRDTVTTAGVPPLAHVCGDRPCKAGIAHAAIEHAHARAILRAHRFGAGRGEEWGADDGVDAANVARGALAVRGDVEADAKRGARDGTALARHEVQQCVPGCDERSVGALVADTSARKILSRRSWRAWHGRALARVPGRATDGNDRPVSAFRARAAKGNSQPIRSHGAPDGQAGPFPPWSHGRGHNLSLVARVALTPIFDACPRRVARALHTGGWGWMFWCECPFSFLEHLPAPPLPAPPLPLPPLPSPPLLFSNPRQSHHVQTTHGTHASV